MLRLSHPFPGQVVNLDLLLCTGLDSELADLFLCLIFTQRPMNDWKIEKMDGSFLDQWPFLAKSIENFISPGEKNLLSVTCHCQKFTNHQHLFDSWISQYSNIKQVAASSYSGCCRLGNTLCLCWPVQPALAVPESCPKSSSIDFAVKNLPLPVTFGIAIGCYCPWQMIRRCLNLDQNLTGQPDQLEKVILLVKVCLLRNPWINCASVEFEIFVGPLKIQKLR